LPPQLDAIRDFTHELFALAALFFKAQHGNYGVFIRKVVRGFGGTSFEAGFMFDYAEDADTKSDCVCLGKSLDARDGAYLPYLLGRL